MNSELLRSFVSIAENGNLTLAAGRLNRTQSAISVQLRKLEADLGVSLFDRSVRGMKLTDAGERLLPRARSILAELRDASALFETPLSGVIRVAVPDDFDDFILGRMLARFSKAHPGVDVIARSDCTAGFLSAIQRGELDIAVYSGAKNREGETLGTERTIWAARQGFEVAPDAPVPLALLDRSCWWRDLPTNALSSIGRDYTIAFRSHSYASIRAAIKAGFAIGVLSEPSFEPGLTELTARDGFPELPVSRRSILRREGAPEALTAAMADAIHAATAEQRAEQTRRANAQPR
ncbi:MAG: LysR family transcriptional regulator [Pseudomonadota bacterium]